MLEIKSRRNEVSGMTNKQLAAFIESLKIIAEETQDPDKIKSALARIQDALKNPQQ